MSTDAGTKGYITMGDNNNHVDQSCVFISKLVEYEDIVSVPVLEIPWLGCVKMMIEGDSENIDKYAPNSIHCIAALLIMMLSVMISFISFCTLCSLREK